METERLRLTNNNGRQQLTATMSLLSRKNCRDFRGYVTESIESWLCRVKTIAVLPKAETKKPTPLIPRAIVGALSRKQDQTIIE